MDKYDISKMTLWRHSKKVSQQIAKLEEAIQIKLYDEFKRCGII